MINRIIVYASTRSFFQIKDLNERILQICALERNEAVRQKIRVEFPESMRKVLERKNDESEGASLDAKRFKRIADDLKVFCVSSHDFLRLKELQEGFPMVRFAVMYNHAYMYTRLIAFVQNIFSSLWCLFCLISEVFV